MSAVPGHSCDRENGADKGEWTVTKRLQMASLAVLAAVGFASVATAQQGNRPAQRAPQAQGAMPGKGMMMGMEGAEPMAMSPEMQKQMSEMMSGCHKMMKSMGGMQGMRMPGN